MFSRIRDAGIRLSLFIEASEAEIRASHIQLAVSLWRLGKTDPRGKVVGKGGPEVELAAKRPAGSDLGFLVFSSCEGTCHGGPFFEVLAGGYEVVLAHCAS